MSSLPGKDPKEIVEEVEEYLREKESSGEPPAVDQAEEPLWSMAFDGESSPPPAGGTSAPQDWRALLGELAQWKDPGALPPGTPLRTLKTALGRASRPQAHRQHHFNGMLLDLLGKMAHRLELLEAERLQTLEKRLEDIHHELLRRARYDDLDPIKESLRAKATYQDLEEIRKQAGVLHEGLLARASYEDLNALRGDLVEVREGLSAKGQQEDVEKLYSGLDRAFRAVEDNARSMEERLSGTHSDLQAVHQELLRRAAYDDLERLEERVEAIREALSAKGSQRDTENLWERVHELQGRLGELREEQRRHEARVLGLGEQQAVLRERLEERPTVAAPPGEGDVPAPPPQPTEADDLLSEAYLRFQREFRGDPADLRERLAIYPPLIEAHLEAGKEAPRVVDLACGDGLFLEMLRDGKWEASGVDLNAAMVRAAREKQLPVEQGDALAWLDGCEKGSIDILTGFQFIEHLTPPELARLLRGARRVLAPGGLLLLETIYPKTVKALQWYFLDLSHQRLVFPEMLSLLAETAGLRPMEWKAIHPVADHERLEGADRDANARRLNDFLYGPQDYYLLARKPS